MPSGNWQPEAQLRSLRPAADETLAAPRPPVTALADPGGLACHPSLGHGGVARAALPRRRCALKLLDGPLQCFRPTVPVLHASPAWVRPSFRPPLHASRPLMDAIMSLCFRRSNSVRFAGPPES